MTTIFLYQGHANPTTIVMRDGTNSQAVTPPTTTVDAGGAGGLHPLQSIHKRKRLPTYRTFDIKRAVEEIEEERREIAAIAELAAEALKPPPQLVPDNRAEKEAAERSARISEAVERIKHDALVADMARRAEALQLEIKRKQDEEAAAVLLLLD